MNKVERKRRGNSRYVLFFLIALFCTVAIGIGIYNAMLRVSWFNLQKVTVINNQSVPTEMILKITSPYMKMNILALPTSEIRKRILRISRVKSVKVQRRLLHTLRIVLQERSGFIYVKSAEGDLYPIDSEGIILEKLSSYYNEDLPILNTYMPGKQLKSGAKLNKPYVQKVLAMHKKISEELPDFLAQISEYYLVDDTIHIIDAKYGTRLVPSDTELIPQLSRYLFVQDNGNINRNTVIDLRFKNQVVVKAGK